MIDTEKLKALLTTHEGSRLKPYKDSVGKLTIGIGRNLDDVGISKEEESFLFDNDLKRVKRDLDTAYPKWRLLSNVRQLVLADMCFNLGLGRLMGFRKMFIAIDAHDWAAAAREMLDSKWAKQVGKRADTLSAMMESDTL